KTMAAQVLARALGLDIYRIDLSQIGSKYIGETEKNLGAVFEAAKFSNAVLFFDEADALFTKRTDVTSSNDKYANAETAYLLQKIEEYSGVSVLATNVMQNFDNAFKRRMTFMIPVEQPGEETRLRLWQKVFPKEAPLEEDIDFGVYARKAELTGSNIKSAALSAAYKAAAEHRKISNRDIIEAIDFEYRRSGRMGISNELYGELYMRT
ncbi:MAG: ATP-binding protein, partial [Acetatifactor sp.]|nr:ATP-binding protein [Acetatifactor sp.]